MKLRVDFDPEDLEQMVTQFFDATGFSVVDLSEVMGRFAEAFPEGLTVNVEPKAVEETTTPSEDEHSAAWRATHDADTEEKPEEPDLEKPENNGGILTMTELMDHTPSDDDLPKMHNLLRQSEAIKADKGDA